jgi:hypothetical protein
MFEIFETQKIVKNLKLLKKFFLKFIGPKNSSGLKNFKHLLISIPKCIELNFESKPKLILFGFGSGSRPEPKQNQTKQKQAFRRN